MADLERVSKGLEMHKSGLCNALTANGKVYCPYWENNDNCMMELLNDAISLLKEQKAEIERLKKPDCEHAEHDGAGCLGYSGCRQDDEPIDVCKGCREYTGNRSGDGEANA